MTQLFIIETEEVIEERAFRLRLEQEAEAKGESLLLPQIVDYLQYGAAVIFEGAKPTVGSFEDLQSDGIMRDAKGNYVTAWKVVEWEEERKTKVITEAKAEKNAQIDREREAANNTSFKHNGLTIACDPLSFKDIASTANNIALFGTFPPAFPGGWKGKDEEGKTAYVPMPTVDDFKAFYASMTAQGTANFNKSQTLKAQLAAAKTIEEINAIAW